MTRNRRFTRDDGSVLEVDYSISGGSAGAFGYGTHQFDEAPCGVEVEIEDAWLLADAENPDAPRVRLTESEEQRFAEEVNADPATWESEPDYD